jgi:N-acetylmuramoyl-L-alanine amidase
MKRTIIFLLLTVAAKLCFPHDTAATFQIKYHKEKIEKYLDKEKALSPYYSINTKGVFIYASPDDKKLGKPEFHIEWSETANFTDALKLYSTEEVLSRFKNREYQIMPNEIAKKERIFSASQKLKGLRIAVDPGHTAHDMEIAAIEMKHIKFKKNNVLGLHDSIEFAEGMLTYAAAQILKAKLEADGAEVFLTRPNGFSAFGKTFKQWLKDDLKNTADSLCKIGELTAAQKKQLLSGKLLERDIFRMLFKDLELAQRAKLINSFKPDLTVIIHYNVDETNLGWTKPSQKDFNMAFIGGAFMKHDLVTSEKRFEFLRLLLSDDLENSILLSTAVVKSFEEKLNVKLTGTNDAKYISQACLPAGTKGVYCRNLQLTRLIHSPLVYGETLYQDNLMECQLLNKETDKTKNERVNQVAEAYYQGILNYIFILK